jgi:hypothetical protein
LTSKEPDIKADTQAAREGRSVLLEPVERDPERIRVVFDEIDKRGGGELLLEGRSEQPPMPPSRNIFKE